MNKENEKADNKILESIVNLIRIQYPEFYKETIKILALYGHKLTFQKIIIQYIDKKVSEKHILLNDPLISTEYLNFYTKGYKHYKGTMLFKEVIPYLLEDMECSTLVEYIKSRDKGNAYYIN